MQGPRNSECCTCRDGVARNCNLYLEHHDSQVLVRTVLNVCTPHTVRCVVLVAENLQRVENWNFVTGKIGIARDTMVDCCSDIACREETPTVVNLKLLKLPICLLVRRAGKKLKEGKWKPPVRKPRGRSLVPVDSPIGGAAMIPGNGQPQPEQIQRAHAKSKSRPQSGP